MSDITAFAPLYTATGPNAGQAGTLIASVTLAATTASQAVVLPPGSSTNQIQIANQTAAWAYMNFGIAGAVVAATVAASYPVAPGAVVVVGVAQEVTGATCILAAGATGASVTFTRGNGL
jgi:hypothetical protein